MASRGRSRRTIAAACSPPTVVAEMGDPQPVEREDEDHVRAALPAGGVVVLGRDGGHRTERRVERPSTRYDP